MNAIKIVVRLVLELFVIAATISFTYQSYLDLEGNLILVRMTVAWLSGLIGFLLSCGLSLALIYIIDKGMKIFEELNK